MKKIVLTSLNPIKLSALQKTVSSLYKNEQFEIVTLHLEKDGVEPIGRFNILKQIQEALDSGKRKIANADYYVCIEGGMEEFGTEMHETAYAVVDSRDGGKGISACASFRVPTHIAKQIKNGKDFATAVDEFYETQGTKQSGGFVGILTGGVIKKEEHCIQALTIAFASADKMEWYN